MTKYLKVLIIMAIFYLLFLTSPVWGDWMHLLWSVGQNFFLAFAMAYALSPLMRLAKTKHVPQGLVLLGTFLVLAGVVYFAITQVTPLVVDQITELQASLTKAPPAFISNPYIIKLYELSQPYLANFSKTALEFITKNATSLLSSTSAFLGNSVIVFFVFLIMVSEMPKYRKGLSQSLRSKPRLHAYIKDLDTNYNKYLVSFAILIGVSFVEYSIAYMIIRHPQWLLIGILAAFGNFIPYFGGIIVNIISLLTALMYSMKLFWIALVALIVLPQIDSYVINPFIYKKTIQIPAVVSLFGIMLFSSAFGLLGVLLSMPIIITVKITNKHFGRTFIQKVKNQFID